MLFLNGNVHYDIDICNVKSATRCKYHSELLEIAKDIQECEYILSSSISSDILERYVKLRNRQDRLRALIAVSEYDDIAVGGGLINVDINEEMKKLLTKITKGIREDKLDINQLNWTSYVRAAINFTSAQSYGSNIEQVYKRKKNYEKVNPSEEKGDAFNKPLNKYIEVKFTVLALPSFQYDIVQIRPHHKIDEYHIISFNKQTDKTELYVLSKQEMDQEIKNTGNSLAHGTKSTEATLINPEYAIRFKIDSDTHKRWQKFRKKVDWS